MTRAKKKGAPRRSGRKEGGTRARRSGGIARRSPRKRRAKPPIGPVLRRLAAAAALGAALGGALVAGGLYREASATVEDRLGGALWDRQGEVLSGPLVLWPGLRLSPEELAGDLERAGYVRAETPERAGDFSAGGDTVRILTRADAGPGWETPGGELLLRFDGGRIASIVPPGRPTLPPARLAAVRGPDNEARSPRDLSHFPEVLQRAVLAMEDDRFWEHRGISPWGIARAALVNALRGERVQGGSTLTQQLVKNLFLSPERSFARKAREALLALAIERRLSKREILGLYLNTIYWGQAGGAAICGADQAARAYFGKPADRLSLGEAATLGGIISAPNTYSPLRHPERALRRRDLTLERMVAVGWLDEGEAAAAAAAPLLTHPAPAGRLAPYAVDSALERAEQALGEGAVLREGLRVLTTIHPPLQRLAERAVRDGLAEVETAHPGAAGVQAALVAVRVSDGAVLAMVGGRSYAESQFNRATLSRRQIGSTVKPITALAAFESDPALSPATPLEDAPLSREVRGERWTPQNYDGRYEGVLSLREAIARSRNIPAVLLAERVGMSQLARFAGRLGLSGAGPQRSAALGAFEASPLELAGAYTVFPGAGRYSAPRLLSAVLDPGGEVLERWEVSRTEVSSARAAYLATSLLESVLEEGTGAGARRLGVTGGAGGKTGTTDGYRDAWFAGFTGELAVAVWVGFDRGGSTGLTGASGALPIWARFVAGSGTAAGDFPRPPSVVLAEACTAWDDGRCAACGEELFSAGEAPERGCKRGRRGDIWEEIERALRGGDRRRWWQRRSR